MAMPDLMRVEADGSGEPEQPGDRADQATDELKWSYVDAPAGRVAGRQDGRLVISDAPEPDESDVVLQFYDLDDEEAATGPNVPENRPLGHQDPAWRPDGRLLLYVRNGREGARGAPVIYRYDVAEDRRHARSRAPATSQPSYSPGWPLRRGDADDRASAPTS